MDWTTGGGPFDIYISDNVAGAGPFNLLASGISGMNYLHVGALTDGLSHAYYVTSDGGATKSNLGFKLIRQLTDVGLATNWIALPYKCDVTTADELMDDINLDNGGVDAVNVASRWDRTLQGYQSRIDVGASRIGINFAIQPGHGYSVKMFTGQSVTWNIVGAAQNSEPGTYIPTVVTTNLVDIGLATSWIALPYNSILFNAQGVMDAINHDGPGGDSVFIITHWNEILQGYQSWNAMGMGINFAIQAGHGYQVKMSTGFPVTFELTDDVLLP
jgi:hypothetical protein